MTAPAKNTEVKYTIPFTDEQSMLLDAAVQFCREKFSIEEVRKQIETEQGFDPDAWQEMCELGWTGICIPENYGGSGLSIAHLVPVVESMGRFLAATPLLATTLASQAILVSGNEQQKETWLPALASGTKTASLAITEPDGSWELQQPQLLAEKSGNGFTLSGTKTFVLDVNTCDALVISASLEGKPALFLIERSALDDSAVDREIVIDETRRSFRLQLNEIELSESALLDADATNALDQINAVGALLYSADMVGCTQGVIDLTVEYLKVRTQFGKPIGSYQGLKHPMAEILCDYDAARSHLYYAASGFDGMQGESEIALRMLKALAGDTCNHAGDRAVQFHGGMGFTYECHAQLFLRRARWGQYSFGDPVHHRKHLATAIFS